MEKIIELKNVCYSYKSEDSETVGVKDVTLDVYEGEFLAVLGHNGSGKSTLAKLLNAFLVPDFGTVSCFGTDTADEKKIFEIRSKVGMVFQNPDNQMVASIIEDDIAFGPENLGVERSEIIRRVDWALDVVGMTEYRNRTPQKLSGGQKQRISIAAVLAMLPKVLILDESTAMLDPKGRKEVLQTVRRLNKEHNMTVILITHYMDEVIDADRIVVMNEGQVLLNGTPNEVFSDYGKIKQAKLELPIACLTSHRLIEKGIAISPCLTVNALVEGLCRLL